MSKQPFAIIEKHREGGKVIAVTYEADFWEGPTEPGEKGRYRRLRFTITNLRNESPNLSYYAKLKAAFA